MEVIIRVCKTCGEETEDLTCPNCEVATVSLSKAMNFTIISKNEDEYG
ncbi:MAG TPA: hypothetical protein PLW95_05765 [bacterium]|nr:hypothetical protein [bacterium]